MTNSVFVEHFRDMDERQRRLFQQAIQELQLRSFVLRGGALRVDPLYAFIDKFEEAIEAYLELGGWRLHLDRELGVARLYHPEGSGRAHFNKEETVLLLTLRLLYHEQKQAVTESLEPVVTVGALRERLHALLPAAAMRPYLSRKNIGRALRRLASFRVVIFEGSSYSVEDPTLLRLSPVIEHLVSPSTVEGVQARLDELGSGAEQSPETSSETAVETEA